MLLLKFFQIIDKSFIGRFIDKKFDLVASTDPDRIYVENIRSFYNITTPMARFFCELAVKEKVYKKMYGIECPTEGRIISIYNTIDEIPDNIVCPNCQLLEEDTYEYKKDSCKIVEFYQLISKNE